MRLNDCLESFNGVKQVSDLDIGITRFYGNSTVAQAIDDFHPCAVLLFDAMRFQFALAFFECVGHELYLRVDCPRAGVRRCALV